MSILDTMEYLSHILHSPAVEERAATVILRRMHEQSRSNSSRHKGRGQKEGCESASHKGDRDWGRVVFGSSRGFEALRFFKIRKLLRGRRPTALGVFRFGGGRNPGRRSHACAANPALCGVVAARNDLSHLLEALVGARDVLPCVAIGSHHAAGSTRLAAWIAA